MPDASSPGNRHAPELSSIASAVDDLTRRVTEIAESLAGSEGDEVAHDLFEVERTLGGARRRLASLSQSLGDGGKRRNSRPGT